MDFSRIVALKGEFEAEGLSRNQVAAESVFAARHDRPYLVKIGGCEAKSDVRFLRHVGVTRIVAPMIESGFAMSKYMAMLPDGAFDHIGVTIETKHAVERIEELLDAGKKLNEVTVGRTDLTASFGGSGVNCTETIAMVKTVARAAARRGLPTTMGGSINRETREMLEADGELRELISNVETRKCVIPVDKFLDEKALADAFAVELALLEMQDSYHGAISRAAADRVEQLKKRT